MILVLCAAPAAAAPDTVAVPAGPPIAAAPEGGLDRDVIARLDAAERATDPGQALDRVLVLYESDDPFSRAQRTAARPRAIAILTKIGEHARAAGDVVTAARALDARWAIDGEHRDPQLAQVLTAWAERDAAAQPARALYLARRARTADPQAVGAARLDDDLSRNHRVWTGRLAIVAGVAALAAGIYARSQVTSIEDDLKSHPRPGSDVDGMLRERDIYDAVGTGLLVAAPVMSIGGILITVSGNPKYTPTSPDELPALVKP